MFYRIEWKYIHLFQFSTLNKPSLSSIKSHKWHPRTHMESSLWLPHPHTSHMMQLTSFSYKIHSKSGCREIAHISRVMMISNALHILRPGEIRLTRIWGRSICGCMPGTPFFLLYSFDDSFVELQICARVMLLILWSKSAIENAFVFWGFGEIEWM